MPETTITINLQGREQVRQAIQSVKTQLDSIKPNFLALTAAAGGLAGAIALIGKKALDEAGDIEKFTATMRTITGSTKEAANMIQFAIKAATQTPFEVKGVVESTATIMQFTKMLGWTGKDAQKWFPLIGDLAAGMGKDLHYTSLVMGKALTGSQDAILSLRDQFGISAQALKAFGAEINKEGGIAVRTAEQQEKLRNALEALIKQNFAGAMARQMDTFQGAMSNLRDALSRVYMAIGKEMIPIFNRWVKESLTPTLEKVENFVKENGKLVIAVGATVGAVSMIVAGLAGLGFILPPLIGGLKALQVLFAVQIPQALAISTTALKTFVFAHPLIAGLTLAITGLTTAFISLKSETDAKIKKFEEDREKTEELIREYNELITIIGKTTEQKERQKAIIEELIKLLPEYADKFRELKGEPIKNIEEINKQLLAQYNLIIQNMTLSEKWGRHLITIFELVTVTIRQAIETAITGLIGFITLLVKMIVDFCKTSLVLIGDFIAGIEGIFKGDFSKIKKAGKNIGEAFTSGTKESFGKHLVEFETEAGKVKSKYDKFVIDIIKKFETYRIKPPKLLTLEDIMPKPKEVIRAKEAEKTEERELKDIYKERLELAESRYKIGKLTTKELIEEYQQVQKLTTSEIEKNNYQERINTLLKEKKDKREEIIKTQIRILEMQREAGKDVDIELIKQYNSLIIITEKEEDRITIQNKIKSILTSISKEEQDKLAILESDYTINKTKRDELIKQLTVMRNQTQDTIEKNKYQGQINDLLEEEKRERKTLLDEQIAITRAQIDLGVDNRQRLIEQLNQLSLIVESESERLRILKEIKDMQKEITRPVVGIGGAMPEKEGWITAPPQAIYTEGGEIKPEEARPKETVFGSIVEGFRESAGELQNIFGIIQESTRQLFDTIAQTGGMAFEKMVFGMQDFSTSVKELWSNLAHSVVNYIGQMITKWLAFLALQEVAGWFGIPLPAFQTAPGEVRKVPGPPTLEVPAIVHGGEIIGRPGEGQIGGRPINVNLTISAGAVLGGNEAQFKQAILDIFKDYDLLSSRNLGRRYS